MDTETYYALKPGDTVVMDDSPDEEWIVMQRNYLGQVIVAKVATILTPMQWNKVERKHNVNSIQRG